MCVGMSFTVNVPFMVKSHTPPALFLMWSAIKFVLLNCCYGRLLVDYKVGGPHLRLINFYDEEKLFKVSFA